MMSELSADTFRIARQRIVQGDRHDHAMRPGDERTLCDRYSAKAVLVHDVAFVPGDLHSCEACTQLVSP